MNETAMPMEEFAGHMHRLATVFNRPVSDELVAEFYRVFGTMRPESYAALVDWAIRNLDSPFPSIARLRKGAVELGFLKAANPKADADRPRWPRDRDADLVYFECPLCEGTFVVFKSKMAEYVAQNAEFECINRRWGCPHTFRAVDKAGQG
jgi:hypothetical protein